MGRMYAAVFEQEVIAAAVDLFEINAPADAVVVLHSLTLSQSSDAGDSESEQLAILIHRASTSGSGGSPSSPIIPSPLNVGDAAFGGTVEAVNTSQGTEGAHVHAEAFNVMAGLSIVWAPETRPVISPSGRIVIELQSVPTDALTLNGAVYFEEIGG